MKRGTEEFEPCLDVTDAEEAIYDRRADGYSGHSSGNAQGVQKRTQDEIE